MVAVSATIHRPSLLTGLRVMVLPDMGGGKLKEKAIRWLTGIGAAAVAAGLAIVFALGLAPRAQARPENYLVYSTAGLNDIPENKILYRETDSVRVPLASGAELRAVCLLPGGGFAAGGGETLFLFDAQRIVRKTIAAGGAVNALAAETVPAGSTGPAGTVVYCARPDQVAVFSPAGELLAEWAPLGERARLSSLAVSGAEGLLYAADAGNKNIIAFDRGGRLKGLITLKTTDETGFLIPGVSFDIAIGARGDLWATDPGRRRVVWIGALGIIIAEWGKSGTAPGEFTGCCNPVHIALFPDGSFAAQEKGLLRITLYDPRGRFRGVAVGPKSFHERNTTLDLAVSANGDILVADPRQKAIRVFSRKGAGR
jgi:hypothetical protein